MWAICSVVLVALPCLGLYAAALFVLQNKSLFPPWRQIVVTLLMLFLVLSNMWCLGFMVVFFGRFLLGGISSFFNEMFIKIFSF